MDIKTEDVIESEKKWHQSKPICAEKMLYQMKIKGENTTDNKNLQDV